MHLRTPIQTLEGLGEAYRPNVKLMATAGLGGVGEGRGWVHRFKIFKVVWTGVSRMLSSNAYGHSFSLACCDVDGRDDGWT